MNERSDELEQILRDQRSDSSRRSHASIDHINNIVVATSKAAVSAVPQFEAIRVDWTASQLSARHHEFKDWFVGQLRNSQQGNRLQYEKNMHAKYGDCILELGEVITMRLGQQQFLLLSRDILPELRILPGHTLDTALSNAHAIKAWLKTSSDKIQNLIERRNEDYQDMAYMLHDTQQREHEARQEIAGLANAVQKAFDVVSQQSAELRRFTGMN
jgi:hypothetical protein